MNATPGLTAADRALAARLCAERTGVRIDPEKAYLIESRLSPLARREGFTGVGDLLRTIRDRQEARLVQAAVEALATRETGFFQDPTLFAALRDEVIPRLARQRPGEPVRIWVAACRGGQEVYSMAMTVADAPWAGARIELFASELSERQLEKAQAGLYSQFEVQRGLPARLLVRHFERREEAFAVSPRLRQMIRWRAANLLEEAGRLGRFDLILCRGMLAIMTEEARQRVLSGLISALAPDGVLVLGPGDAAAEPGLTGVPEIRGAYTPKALAHAAA
ncbi:CheR family methyltransferase [Phenylobacterium sp.]|uniref:CheR family methyltransferase n=1 Tax=Phenylobacterium sp. TaxID=1871053 RepID=UPI0037845E44